MGPGPSNVHPRVLAAMARPTIGHMDPAFLSMMDELKTLLQYTQYTFCTCNDLTLAISAPGSAGMETCFVTLLETGDRVIGMFGSRMKENIERCDTYSGRFSVGYPCCYLYSSRLSCRTTHGL
ncbi:Serine--pyruvate aminotransferase / L-alanine:glyoxylate aminotransferase [invertebrate metagenome]|uniref:Serine--pyruvate aminotransferase / L-alanine:glyoxylate aminotransferase n=1 Tax=invertebrate metagenome TaxID=1711999 RepID=A0A484H611_9ZZZZ